VNVPSFSSWGGGENYIGEAARSTEENILHNKEIELVRNAAQTLIGLELHNRHLLPSRYRDSACPHGSRRPSGVVEAFGGGSFTFHADSNRARTSGHLRIDNPEQCWAPHAVACALYVVVPVAAIRTSACPHIISSNEKEYFEMSCGCVGALALCGHSLIAQRMQTPLLPQSWCDFLEAFPREPQVCEANSMVKGASVFLILVQSVHPLAKEVVVRETVVEQDNE